MHTHDALTGPHYATFACTTYRDWLEGFERGDSDPEAPMPEGCQVAFVDHLPSIALELPVCPYCEGPSMLDELLMPVTG